MNMSPIVGVALLALAVASLVTALTIREMTVLLDLMQDRIEHLEDQP